MGSVSILALFGLLAAKAVAQTTTSSSAMPTALPSLVSEIPSCAMPCWNEVKTKIGCDAGDLKCMCEISGELNIKMGICLPVGDCTKDQISLTDNLPNAICDTTNNNSNSDAIASAPKILSGAVAKATATASSTSKPKATNAVSPLGQSIELALVIAAAAVIL